MDKLTKSEICTSINRKAEMLLRGHKLAPCEYSEIQQHLNWFYEGEHFGVTIMETVKEFFSTYTTIVKSVEVNGIGWKLNYI